MKIELSDDAIAAIMKSILLSDYRGLCDDIDRLVKNSENLMRYQAEDLGISIHYKQAMESILEYYIGKHWRDEL